MQRWRCMRGKREKSRRSRSIRRFQDSRRRVESSRNATERTGDRYIVRARIIIMQLPAPQPATCRADASILPGPWQQMRNQFYCISCTCSLASRMDANLLHQGIGDTTWAEYVQPRGCSRTDVGYGETHQLRPKATRNVKGEHPRIFSSARMAYP